MTRLGEMLDWRAAFGRVLPIVALVGWFYLAVLMSLAVWIALTWVALGWRPALVSTEELLPELRPGDVVMIGAPGDGSLLPGAVIRVGRDDQARIARIEEVTAAGDYVSRDGLTVGRDDVTAVGRLLVPAVGSPLLWLRDGRSGPLLLALVVTGVAVVLAVLARRSRTVAVPATAPLEDRERAWRLELR